MCAHDAADRAGSLTNNEVYAVVAFLLAQNEIIDKAAVMDSANAGGGEDACSGQIRA
jgi:hypothetical protein